MSLYLATCVLIRNCMCPYALLHVTYLRITRDVPHHYRLWKNRSRRREKFLLRGVERMNITRPRGHDIFSATALCCEAVCFIGIRGWHRLQHLIPGTMLKGIITTWILCMCPYDYMHVSLWHYVYVSLWLYACVLMTLCVCPYDYMPVSSHTQMSRTSCLYGGLKRIQTLGSVIICADHCVRDLFDIITVYGGMPLPQDHVESWLHRMVFRVKSSGVNRTFLVLTTVR